MTSTSTPYLRLLKKMLIDYQHIGRYEYHPLDIVDPNWKTAILFPLHALLRRRNFGIHKRMYVHEKERLEGLDWPANALTMIGMKRLDNIEFCLNEILRNNIPGDCIETGVWRGGATMWMKAILNTHKADDRKVWLADSFCGLPRPNEKEFPMDAGNPLHSYKILTASLEEVRQNFEHYDLLDERVVFLKGWFKDTLPTLSAERFSLIRLDGDLYESTWQALENLYPNLSDGGFVIIDDYHAFPYCKAAVDDYRSKHAITEELIVIDQEAVFWKKNG